MDAMFRPKKSLGQHFLIDGNIARKIIDLAAIAEGDRVVEIGPGRGILTKPLLRQGANVIAIEIDPVLSEGLKSDLAHDPHFQLVLGDARQYPYPQIDAPFKVVANLPYNVATPILFRLLQERGRLTEMVVMVQKEVADRLAAKAGSKDYGVLSVLFQLVAEVKIAFTVSPNCFRPRPKVASAVIKITLLKEANVPVADEPFFAKVVHAAFSHRRKFLLNGLTDAGFARDRTIQALTESGIDPRRRAETLLLSEFAALANRLFNTPD